MSAGWSSVPVALTLGDDVPSEVLRASGMDVVALESLADEPVTGEDRGELAGLLGRAVDPAAASVLTTALRMAREQDVVVVSTEKEAWTRVHRVLTRLRELGRPAPRTHLVDITHLDRPASVRYAVRQVEGLVAAAALWTGRDVSAEMLRLELEASALRPESAVPGGPVLSGRPLRVLLAGSRPVGSATRRAIEERGGQVVAHECDLPSLTPAFRSVPGTDLAPVVAEVGRAYAARVPVATASTPARRARLLTEHAVRCGVEAVVAVHRSHDDAPRWDEADLRGHLQGASLPLAVLSGQGVEPHGPDLDEALELLRRTVVTA